MHSIIKDWEECSLKGLATPFLLGCESSEDPLSPTRISCVDSYCCAS